MDGTDENRGRVLDPKMPPRPENFPDDIFSGLFDSRVVQSSLFRNLRSDRNSASSKMKDFLVINTATNAIDSLLRAEEFIRRVESEGNPFLWKWIIICLHHSLYTFSIIVAAGTNKINVADFNKKHMKKMFVEAEDETTGKKTDQLDYDWIVDNIHSVRLVDFLKAVKRACAAKPFVHSRPLELTGSQKNSILYLRDRRNELEHFEPN